MKDAVTKLHVPRNVRVFGYAPPERQRVSPEAVAALSVEIERNSWSALMARRPDLAERIETAKSRRRA